MDEQDKMKEIFRMEPIEHLKEKRLQEIKELKNSLPKYVAVVWSGYSWIPILAFDRIGIERILHDLPTQEIYIHTLSKGEHKIYKSMREFVVGERNRRVK